MGCVSYQQKLLSLYNMSVCVCVCMVLREIGVKIGTGLANVGSQARALVLKPNMPRGLVGGKYTREYRTRRRWDNNTMAWMTMTYTWYNDVLSARSGKVDIKGLFGHRRCVYVCVCVIYTPNSEHAAPCRSRRAFRAYDVYVL